MAIVRELVTILGFKVDDKKIRQAEGALKRYTGQARKAVKTSNNLGSSLTRLAGAFVGLHQIGRAARGIFDVNREFERLEAMLRTLTGSTEEAEASFRFITDFAKKTPFQVDELTASFIRLQAVGITPFTMEGGWGAMETLFTDVGDLAAAMQTDFDNLILSAQQAGAGRTQRLMQALKTSVETSGNVIRVVFQGQTFEAEKTTEKVLEMLQEIAHAGGFAGAMAEQMNTLVGAFSNLDDIVALVVFNMGKASGLNDQLTRMAQTISDLAGDPLTGEGGLTVRMGRFLAASVTQSTRAIVFLNEHASEFARIMAGLGLYTVGRGLNAVALGLGGAMTGGGALFRGGASAARGGILGGIGLMLGDFSGYLSGMRNSATRVLLESGIDSDTPMGRFATQLGSISRQYQEAGSPGTGSDAWFHAMADALYALIGLGVDALITHVPRIVAALVESFSAQMGALRFGAGIATVLGLLFPGRILNTITGRRRRGGGGGVDPGDVAAGAGGGLMTTIRSWGPRLWGAAKMGGKGALSLARGAGPIGWLMTLGTLAQELNPPSAQSLSGDYSLPFGMRSADGSTVGPNTINVYVDSENQVEEVVRNTVDALATGASRTSYVPQRAQGIQPAQ